MRHILLTSFIFLLIGCGPKSIPYSQKTNAIVPSELARVHDQWGLEYAQAGDLSQAITEFRLAIKHEPRWAIPHYNIGSVYGNMGMLDNAISAWERATQLDPDFAKAHYNLAVVYAVKSEKTLGSGGKRQYIEKAIISLREAIRVDKSALNAANLEEAFNSIREIPEFMTLFEKRKQVQ